MFLGTIHDYDQLVEFAELGAYCEYDLFGSECSHYDLGAEIDMPSDAERIRRIKHLIDNGFEDRIVIGHDLHSKHGLVGWNSLFSVNKLTWIMNNGTCSKHVGLQDAMDATRLK